MKVDLHLHTWISDGEAAPASVARLALAGGLDLIAITDHDTAAGVQEAQSEAANGPLHVIPGIEISTRWEDHELHILGYWIDPASPPILEHQERAVRRRSDRMLEMVSRLQQMGLEIDFADVEVAAGPAARTLGRPHLARALHARGHTRYYGEAFTRFIGDGGPAFVGEGFPLPEHAIATIHAAGGVAVWAHPPRDWYLEGLPLLKSWGLDGVECFRPGTLPDDAAILHDAALQAGLFPTGGSDWHGPHRSALGDFHLDAAAVRTLLALGGVEV
jgi:3',5'-nucleoside bisphosphate phosphatase